MSDTVSKASVKELMDAMDGRFNVIEELMKIVNEYHDGSQMITDRVVDEINFARRIMGIYKTHLLSTEQTDDFDGHPNTII